VVVVGETLVVGHAAQVGHASPLRLNLLAGLALLSPLKLASPHGHGGHVVVGATVVGLGVNWTGGEVVVMGATVVVGATVVGHAAQVGHASPLRLILLAGEALLSPDRLASPHGHGGQVVVGALVVGCGVN